MSRVEIESFLKSFLLFFTSLGILIATLFYLDYNRAVKSLDETLFSQMRVCSYDLKCERFSIDFVPVEKLTPYILYKNSSGLNSYFPVPGANDYLMQLHFPADDYQNELQTLINEALLAFAAVIAVVFILSILFSLYALYPLRNALLLTQEFIKDILHDFNTPLASLRLNSAMLRRELGENDKVMRIEQSVQNVLDLQHNLRSYLHDHAMQKEIFDFKQLIEERIMILEKNYPDIAFSVAMEPLQLHASREAFARIIENILSNAAKYNRQNGTVRIEYAKRSSMLKIIDTGKGINDPKRIFERFYKEQERGIGIGLHIVKKLCDELGIRVSVESEAGRGTTFMLNLSPLTHH